MFYVELVLFLYFDTEGLVTLDSREIHV